MTETVPLTAKALPASIGLAAGALALGYGANGSWGGVIVISALGFLWLLGQWRGWGWTASVGLVCCVGIAAVGLGMRSGTGWMLLGVVAALSAWDLDHFARRLRGTGRIESIRGLERRRLQRLLIVGGAGLLFGTVALESRVDFGFGAALLLGALATLGLARAISFLRRESD